MIIIIIFFLKKLLCLYINIITAKPLCNLSYHYSHKKILDTLIPNKFPHTFLYHPFEERERTTLTATHRQLEADGSGSDRLCNCAPLLSASDSSSVEYLNPAVLLLNRPPVASVFSVPSRALRSLFCTTLLQFYGEVRRLLCGGARRSDSLLWC